MNKDDLTKLAALCAIVDSLEMRSAPEKVAADRFREERDRLIDKLTKGRA